MWKQKVLNKSIGEFCTDADLKHLAPDARMNTNHVFPYRGDTVFCGKPKLVRNPDAPWKLLFGQGSPSKTDATVWGEKERFRAYPQYIPFFLKYKETSTREKRVWQYVGDYIFKSDEDEITEQAMIDVEIDDVVRRYGSIEGFDLNVQSPRRIVSVMKLTLDPRIDPAEVDAAVSLARARYGLPMPSKTIAVRRSETSLAEMVAGPNVLAITDGQSRMTAFRGIFTEASQHSGRSAYLLKWNPKIHGSERLPEFKTKVATTRGGERVRLRWSTDGATKIRIGDRLFLFVKGNAEEGIFGAGYCASHVVYAPHWNGSGVTETYIEADIEVLLDLSDVLGRNILDQGVLGSIDWDSAKSCIEIKPKSGDGIDCEVLPELERKWHEHLYSLKLPFLAHEWPQEPDLSGGIEGKRKQRIHWFKERDPKVVRTKKSRALEKEGVLRCEACNFVFEHFYGAIGATFIECHHTIPIAEIDEGHETKLEDLALLCSNCHRMIHASSELLTVNDLKAMIAATAQTTDKLAF